MTRINAGVKVTELHRRHLVAELREITMVPAALRRSLRTRSVDSILSTIPVSFSLNTNHVKFFYNKLSFLQTRFGELAAEMVRRGYHPDHSRIVAFEGFPPEFYGQWTPTPESRNIVLSRITQRIAEKPWLYEKD